MRPFSVDWREALAAVAIFLVIMLAFALLASAGGWPNEKSGWPVAVGVATALALLRVAGPALDYLQQAGAKVETPFLKIDFAGATRVAGIPGQPWVLSDDLIRKSPSIPDSALPELERSIEKFADQAEVVIDLEDGGAWYTTRLFAVAATAKQIGSPKYIILIGQRNGVSQQFAGWIKPADIVKAFSRRDQRFSMIDATAHQYISLLRTHSTESNYSAPATLSRYQNYLPKYQLYGDIALIRILVDHMIHPENAAPLENPQQPPWIDLGELERMLAPWLVSEQVKVDQAPKEQVILVLKSRHDLIASTRNGQFVGMVDVRNVERDIVRQLVERASV